MAKRRPRKKRKRKAKAVTRAEFNAALRAAFARSDEEADAWQRRAREAVRILLDAADEEERRSQQRPV